MAEGFAGSRSLDERRRRRLAGERVVHDGVEHFVDVDSSAESPEPARFERQSDFPISRLISHRLWKLVASVGAVVGLTVWLISFGSSLPIQEAALGENVSRIFELPGGSAFTWFSSFLLLGSAQLAFIIGWVRSRNPRDFNGQYRIWRWAAGCYFIASICVATGLHQAGADVLTHYFDAGYPHQGVLNWLVPCILVCLPIVFKILYDMSNCWTSITVLGMALSVAVIFAITPVVDRWQADTALLVSGRLIVCCGMFCSMLIHSWYVVHVSSDPPGQTTQHAETQVQDWYESTAYPTVSLQEEETQLVESHTTAMEFEQPSIADAVTEPLVVETSNAPIVETETDTETVDPVADAWAKAEQAQHYKHSEVGFGTDPEPATFAQQDDVPVAAEPDGSPVNPNDESSIDFTAKGKTGRIDSAHPTAAKSKKARRKSRKKKRSR